MKAIYYLPLVLALIVSCNGPQQSKTDLCPDKNSVAAPALIPVVRSIRDIPWADPALLAKLEGC